MSCKTGNLGHMVIPLGTRSNNGMGTIEGADMGDGAGSLCRGWSALPVYYYHKLLKN